MEKQRNGRELRFIFGLLTVCIVGFVCGRQRALWAEDGGGRYLQALTAECASSPCYAGADCLFRLTVPLAAAEDVNVEMPELPVGVDFKSLRRFKYAENGGGTVIEVGLCFAASGKYTLPPLAVTADGLLYPVPFELVEIENLPSAALPRLFAQFDGAGGEEAAFSAGKPAQFTLFAEYAEKIVDLTWKAPQNALFDEIERYKNDDENGHPDGGRFAVARFEWTPYQAGRQTLPEICATLLTLDGERHTVFLERTALFVQVAAQKTERNAEKQYFSRAFDAAPIQADSAAASALSAAECAELAALRSRERHSAYLSATFYQRKQFERSHGILNGSAEPVKLTVFAAAAFAVLSVCAGAVCFFLKKARAAAVASCCALAFTGAVCVSAARFSEKHGIFTGGSVSAAPEASATSAAYCPAGVRVKIKRKSGEWYNIRFGTAEGWAMQDSVEEIK